MESQTKTSMIRRAYRISSPADPEVSEPGAVRRPGHWFDAPLHAPYVFVVGVENKIHIVNITI